MCLMPKLYAYFQKVCRHYYDETVYAYPGLKEVLIELKKEGIKTAVVTSKLPEKALYTLKFTGLEGLFDLVIASDDVTSSEAGTLRAFLRR
jgi:phosphoglycolate phosphatase-like HAD superfamily hydrolase